MRFVLIAALVACGPSASELRAAQTAVYQADPHQLFRLAQEETQRRYRIRDIDGAAFTFTTLPRFYDSSGLVLSLGSLGPDADGRSGRSRPGTVSVSFVVELLVSDAQKVIVKVVPKTFEVVEGSPRSRELKPDDPDLPPFVTERAGALAIAIYDRAKPYIAK